VRTQVTKLLYLSLLLTQYVIVVQIAWAQEALPQSGLPGFTTFQLTKENWSEAASIISKASLSSNPLIIIKRDVPSGPLPVRVSQHVRILDFRYGGGINLVRGHHPRLEGIWGQYAHLGAGLRQNITISDVISPDATVTDWRSNPKAYSSTKFSSPAEYHHKVNHYQNLMSEVWNFNPSINGVAIWGDSGAFVPGSKVWGGFFSARSWPLYWQEYVPKDRPPFTIDNFDAQLIGLEIDVLNAGKDSKGWGPENAGILGKTGLQIVGFGKQNTQAIEIRSEDSDSPDAASRKGQWKAAMVVYNSLAKDGRVIYGLFEEAGVGIDFDQPVFEHGAVRLHTKREGQGVIFNGGQGGQIYADESGTLTLSSGAQGFRVMGPSGNEAIRIGSDGKVVLSSVTLDTRQLVGAFVRDPVAILIMVGIAMVLFLPVQLFVTYLMLRRRRLSTQPGV
jgi:hypothetical protein